MNDDINFNIVHRYLAGECTVQEKRQVLRWMKADPANREAMENLKKIWHVQPRKELTSDIKSAWEQLEEQLEQREQISPAAEMKVYKKRSYHRDHSKTKSGYGSVWLRVAAVVVLAFLLSLFMVEFSSIKPGVQSEETAMREVVTKRAHQAELTFSDGSKVVLNADSRIRFPERFDSNVREVFLEGEAYFEVAHEGGVEFIVQTANTRVKVLGTKFNVKARPESGKAEVAVAQGKVSVQSKVEASSASDNSNDLPEVILVRGQMSTVRHGQMPDPPRVVNVTNYLTWLRGDFMFDQEPFSDVLREWERRFDVDFEVKDSALSSVLFTGEFRNESLDEMLRLASQSLKFTYHRNDRIITINKQ